MRDREVAAERILFRRAERVVTNGSDALLRPSSDRPRGTPSCTTSSPARPATERGDLDDHLIHRDNTFGTPEEDAFAATSRSTHCFTTSRRFVIDSSRPRRSARARRAVDRRSRRAAARRSGAHCCERSRLRRGSTLRSSRRWSTPSAPIGTRSRRPRCRGCSRSTTRFCARARRRSVPRPGRGRAARADLGGAASRRHRRALEITRCARCVSPAFESTPDTFTNAILLGACWCL